MANLQQLKIDDTGNLNLPVGTNSNRPSITAPTVSSFTSVGTTTWTCPAGVTSIEVLVVGGGGGGGGVIGGGGGGGGVIYNPSYSVTPGNTYTVVVGSGGTGGIGWNNAGQAGSQGGNSRFDTLIAIGGGGGSAYGGASAPAVAGTGGSGGGGTNSNGGAGTLGQGNLGGSGDDNIGGGGGGAGGRGEGLSHEYDTGGNGDNFGNGVVRVLQQGGSIYRRKGGEGGVGIMSSISGTPTYYGGGGGGGGRASDTDVIAKGGLGGGGNGTRTTSVADNGVNNTGGGGGGGGYDGGSTSRIGGNGGSGVVILRYALSSTSTIPTAQTRFNTETKNLENYSADNVWRPIDSKGEGIVTNGLRVNLDPLLYTSGSTWYDISGNGYNATIYGSPTYNSSVGYFDFGSSTHDTKYFTIPAGALNGATEFTIGMWLYTNETNAIDTIFTAGAGNDLLMYLTRSVLNFQNTASHDLTYPNNLKNWFYFTATGKNNILKLYRNGNLVSQKNVGNTNVSVTSSLGIVLGQEMDAVGGGFDATQSYRGRYGNIHLYNRELTQQEVKTNFMTTKARYGVYPVMINTGAAAPGSSPQTAAESASQIKELTGTEVSGWYWIRPKGASGSEYNHGNSQPIRLWCDMLYDGGGWHLVMNNVLAGSYSIGTNGMGNITYWQSINNVTYNGNIYDNKMIFRTLVGLKYWESLGKNVVQFCSTSPTYLHNTAGHTKRYRYTYTGFNSTYAAQGTSSVGDDGSGAGAPGMYDHWVSAYNWTATDRDQDTYGSNCANLYGNNPYWYSACWSGNMWGGGTSGYQDGPFWTSSGGDYHNYMAVYLK